MLAEIITIGDELLIGQTIDTNSAWLGKNLSEIGVGISRKTAISDQEQAIIDALNEAFSRSDLVIMTGGLGPTKDDLTKQTLAKYYGVELIREEKVLKQLEDFFLKRNRDLLEINKMQADLPSNCRVLYNEKGTAPGMLFFENGKMLISMPGVPYEMQHIMEGAGFEAIKNAFQLPYIQHLTALTIQVPESLLSKKLEDVENRLPSHIKLAYLPHFNTIRLRLSGTSNNMIALKEEMQDLFNEITRKCGSALLAKSDTTPLELLTEELLKNPYPISLAESCTGGYLSHQLTLTPGISKVFKGSLISYANEIKISDLGVPQEIIQNEGAVSAACAEAMVRGVQKKFDTRYAIATTGIAGPTGATENKPLGTIYIATIKDTEVEVKHYHLFGDRMHFMARASNLAFADLYRRIVVE